jgi:uncharacterized repeat protein (TIGR01451 family)
VEANQLTWTMGALQAGQAHTLQVVFRSTRVGPVTNCANVTTVEGLRAENCATTQITAPQLTVAKTGPANGVVNVPITYQITVSNPGTGAATNVVLTDEFDAGLEHESRSPTVELRIGTLGPNETKTIPLVLTPRKVGQLMNRVTAAADGNLRAQAQHPVTVQLARMTLSKNGPTARFVDRQAIFDIHVNNPGEVALNNVVVRDQLPPELAFVSATEGGQATTDGQVTWNIGTLQPKQEHVVQVTTRCLRLTPRAANVAVATADPGLREQAEAALEIRGVPAFLLETVVVDNPIEVGGKTLYRVDVTNQGTLPGNQVEIVATIPKEMRVLDTNGPTKARIDGQRVIFPPVDTVAPKQTLSYAIRAEALQPGDVRFRVELRSAQLREPVIKEEPTTIYSPGPGPAPAPAAPAVPPGSGAAASPPAPAGAPSAPTPTPPG